MKGGGMTTLLIIIAIVVAAYVFAAITFHYGFKNWHPMCGGKSSTCRGGESRLPTPGKTGSLQDGQRAGK
jgi:hypothetical protein